MNPQHKSAAINYHARERNGEWQVLHGNKIIARYPTEAEATAHVRRCIGQARPDAPDEP